MPEMATSAWMERAESQLGKMAKGDEVKHELNLNLIVQERDRRI